MRHIIERLHGPAPTPEEVDAAIARARELRSEVLHGYLVTACSGLGRTFRHLRPAILPRPAATFRRSVAPTQVHHQPFWSMPPVSPRWLHALRNRVL